MCFGICWFIRIWINLVIEVNVFLIYSLSKIADRIQWPIFRAVHNVLKRIFSALLVKIRGRPEVHYHSEEDNLEEVRRGNAYVDDLLLLVKEISPASPFRTEDKVIGFNNTVISMNIHGELRLSPSIKLCYNFKRSRDCSLQREDGRLRVNASVGGSILPLEATVQVKFLSFTKFLNVSGEIPYVETYIEFDFDAETLRDGRLTEFILLDMSGVNLRFVGAGPLNCILNFTTNNLIKFFKKHVTTILQEEIQTQLAILIADFKFPVERARPSTLKDSDEQGAGPSTLKDSDEQGAGPSTLKDFDEQGARSSTPENSHSDEQGVKPNSPEDSHSDEQGVMPSTLEIPAPVTLRKERVLSHSSEESDASETDDVPSLEA